MSLREVVVVAVVVLAVLLVGLCVFMLLQRSARRGLDAHRDARRTRLRAQVLEHLLAGTPGAIELSRADRRVLMGLAGDLSDKLTGDARHDLAQLLRDLGLADEAIRNARRFGSERRAKALHVLGVVAPVTPEARSLAEQALGDRSFIVRATAVRTLGRRGDPDSALALLAALDAERQVPAGLAVQALLAIGPEVVPVLVDAVHTAGPHGRSIAVDFLGHLGSVEAVPDLLDVLRHEPVLAIRARSARALGAIGSPKSYQGLLDALEPHNPVELRAAAARALGRLGDPRATPWLVAGLDDSSDDVAAASGQALTTCGADALGLLEVLSAPETRAAAHAAAALAEHRVLLTERAQTVPSPA